MFRTLIATAGFCAVIAASSSVFAQDTMSVRVSYADLNLSSPAGAAALTHRVDQAVLAICGSADIRDMGRQTYVSKCKADTLSAARVQLEQAMNTAGQIQPFIEARQMVLSAH